VTLDSFWLLAFALLGACLGSFANVVIYRLPRGESIVLPGSHCTACQKPVVWYDNIPIFSWFILRGRCRHCKSGFSIRYALVEILMSVLFAGLYFKFGFSWLLLEYTVLVFGLVTVSFIDFDHMILPDVFTLSGIVLGLFGAALNPLREFWPAVGGFLLGGGSLWAVATVYAVFRKQEGMGGGDIKLLAWIGAVLGWTSVPFVIISSSLFGSLVGLALLLRNRQDFSRAIPFGPYLAAGAIIFIFCGQEISDWYISLFIPNLSPVN